MSGAIKQAIYAMAVVVCLLISHTIAEAASAPIQHLRGKVLTHNEVDKLLATRVEGVVGCPELESGEMPILTFELFAESFACTADIGENGPFPLMTGDPEVRKSAIKSNWPSNYKPTLKEMLDMVASDTSSTWKYVTEGDARLGPSVTSSEEFRNGLVLFEFTKTARNQPLTLSVPPNWTPTGEWPLITYMPNGWKTTSPAQRIEYVPMTLEQWSSAGGQQAIVNVIPWGLQVQSMGAYSADSKADEAELLSRIPIDNSIELAKNVHTGTTKDMLKRTKVGKFDAWYFEWPVLPLKTAKQKGGFVWRQWVFMDGNKCYGLTSCVPKNLDDQIEPVLTDMVGSLSLRQ